MAFVGPLRGPKILGKNHQSTTKVTLNEPPIKSQKTNHFLHEIHFIFSTQAFFTNVTNFV